MIFKIGAATALQDLKSGLTKPPKSWKGSDPCGTKWVGITCINNRVVNISLPNLNLVGKLSVGISALSELQKLDLTSNLNMTGPLPPNIGNLKKLTILHLMGCGFTGQIPESIGDLEQLTRLSLNSNKFTGTIPASIGRLSKLNWLDITNNQIQGKIPVSNGTSSPGLDMLLQTDHFHLGNNKLTGDIPEKLFSANMTLKHVLFDGNQFTGEIPKSLSLVKTLNVLRLDRNRLSGNIPPSLKNLTNLMELYLANNMFTGSLPNLASLTNLYTLDVSNNKFNFSHIPSWISSLPSLSTLRMEGINLEGPIPITLFKPTLLQTVILNRNWLEGTLDFGTNYSNQLELVDLRNNRISEYKSPPTANKIMQVTLENNPMCPAAGNMQPSDYYCKGLIQQNTTTYVLKKEKCCNPITGTLNFRSPSFSGVLNTSFDDDLEKALEEFFKHPSYPVSYVAVGNREENSFHHLLVYVQLFPYGKERFNPTDMATVISGFTTQSFTPPYRFGPYVFKPNPYNHFSANMGVVIAAVVGASVLLLLLLAITGIYAIRQKRRAQKATDKINPFAKWNMSQSSIDAPQLMVAKAFTFEEMRKCADNFSEENDIGGGGYGQVYKGILPNGQLIAIKRAQPGSLQGGLEFKTEIELLSRVHHKNVVRLLGFCFDRGEQMLVYEYIPNGSLRDSLSGKNGIRLVWTRRLRIALGSGKGLAYLHELADPPIIHRDIKSHNILLDESLTAKVADFGLSKLVGEAENPQVTTQVKGTMGYLDPEYYMTNQLTAKSDVYGFGVVMFELLTGKTPIDNGKHVVREVKMKINKSKKLYDLQELLDTVISSSSENLEGLEKYVDLALRCVDQEGVNRPSMSEVVKEIENIMEQAGLNPNVDSAASSKTFEEANKGS
ncbi:hypothetical protein CARUB_v10028556mg, partial [Capsella rubella]